MFNESKSLTDLIKLKWNFLKEQSSLIIITCCNSMVSIIVLYTFLGLSRCTDFQDTVFRNLLQLCSAQYFPAENETRLDKISEFNGCCIDPFNSSTSHYVQTQMNEYETLGQTCLFPRTDGGPNDHQAEKSYYMVTQEPEAGCVLPDKFSTIGIDALNKPTCNDSEILKIRRFLPVFSISSRFIYKNPHCAYCHGQTDILFWQVYASCDESMPLSADVDICEYKFFPLDSNIDVRHLECFTDSFNSCPDDFQGDRYSNVDMSTDEITRACMLDTLPRFIHRLITKNVFCYICLNNKRLSKLDRCIPLGNPSDIRDPGNNNFIRMLDPRVIDEVSMSGEVTLETAPVCGLDNQPEVCHVVLCPQGQLMIHDGDNVKCQLDSTMWRTARFTVLLRLDFHDPVDITPGKAATIKNFRSPWSALWNTKGTYIPYKRSVNLTLVRLPNQYNITDGIHVVNLTHVFVEVSHKHQSVNPKTFLADIQNTLPKLWTLKKDGQIYTANQSIARYLLDQIEVKNVPGHLRQASWHALTDDVLAERFLYLNSMASRHTFRATIISPLVFCRQIELSSTNFRILRVRSTAKALYHHQSDRFYFDNEFVRGRKMNGKETFRICVSDFLLNSAANNGVFILPEYSILLFLSSYLLI